MNKWCLGIWIFVVIFVGMKSIQSAEHGGSPVGPKNVTPPEKFDKQGSIEVPEKVAFGEKDVKDAITKHIQTLSPQGVMSLIDADDHGKLLKLSFVKIHDPVRKLKNNTYFACTDFHISDDSPKVYDIDFWLTPFKGQLKVTRTKVHKDPVLVGTKWEKKPRYTFQGDDIVPLN